MLRGYIVGGEKRWFEDRRNKIFILGYNSAENSNDLGEKERREAYVMSDATVRASSAACHLSSHS